MKAFISRVVLTAMFVCGSAVADTDTQSVLRFADGMDTGGLSHLTRTGDTILVTIEVEGLVPGDAVTLWWVVFNNPAGCTAPFCGTDDDFTEEGIMNAQIGVGNASGNVVKSNGTMELGGALRKMENHDHQILFGAAFGAYLLTVDPDDAEVHMVLQNHGQGRGGEKLREQLTYFEANCTPSCEDVQFAVHSPP